MANVVTETCQNPSMPVYVALDSGERRNVASANATLRGGRGVSVNVDVFDPELCAANMAAVTGAVMAFVQDVFSQAAAQGVPVSGTGTSNE
jgi:hypothetical protein